MLRGVVVAAGLGVAALTCAASSNLRARMLPDYLAHLDYAELRLDQGRWEEAVAHSAILLMEGSVKVSVDLGDVPDRERKGCLAALSAAFACWQDGIDGDTQFVLVDDPADAQVQVSFTRHLRIHGLDVAGYTRWQRSVRSYADGQCEAAVTASVSLIAETPGGRAMGFRQLRHAAAHELGHILGLQDSRRIGDVMGPLDLRRPALGPSPGEIDALLEARDEAFELRRRALALLPTDP